MPRPRKAAAATSSSMYQAPDGNWHARVTTARRPDGSAERRHLQRRTKAELRTAVRELEQQRDSGTYRKTTDDPTLADWLGHWLDVILPLTVRWKTLSTYRSQMRLHVLPYLGGQRLSEIEPEHLEAHYRRLRTEGHSPHTVRAVHRVLRSSLNEAVRRRRLAHNPAAIARPPRIEEVEVEPLTVEESRLVLAAAGSTLNPPRWSIALCLGLRQGEALGLFWDDIDFDDGVIRVRRSVQRHTWSHGCGTTITATGEARHSCGRRRGAECEQRRDGGLLLVDPKTKSSRRTIAVPTPLMAELRSHRSEVQRRRLTAGEGWDATHPLVFPASGGGIVDPARDQLEWKALLKRADVRAVRLHDARHTAATLLLLQQVDLRTVMSIMGWTEMATAQRYTHAVDDLRRRAAAKMGSLLWESTG